MYDLGVSLPELDTAVSIVHRVIQNVLDSSLGQWLFDVSHTSAQAEWRLWNIDNSAADTATGQSLVDRSFIDNQLVRWTIDYKIAEPQAEEAVGQFIKSQSDFYRDQLSRYHKLVMSHDISCAQEVKSTQSALYFPLIDHLEIVDV